MIVNKEIKYSLLVSDNELDIILQSLQTAYFVDTINLTIQAALAKQRFHPAEYVHDYDTMAAQKLLLEHNEEEVKKVANYS